MSNKIWIIGAGQIAQEYAKILNSLNRDFLVIGRGETRVTEFINATGYKAISGGLDNYISTSPSIPEFAIVATDVSSLASSCISLIKAGVKKIFCEKPGFLYPKECKIVSELAIINNARVFIAYNRRFYASVKKAIEIIKEDGGVKSFNFEFTEWTHIIEKLEKPKAVFDNWFYANSTHVVDLAFFLGGNPIDIKAYTSGKISWHKPIVFAGAGITDKGALFNYEANWIAPGRWGVEILTSKHRLYLRPMEQLQIQDLGSIAINKVNIDDSLDIEYKPGFYLQTKAFLEDDYTQLCTIEEQRKNVDLIYSKILGK